MRHKTGLVILIVIVIGFVLPQRFKMPVEGATKGDYNIESFWYYPWGRSITHKGVDIFAKEGTNLYPSTNGIVIYSGQLKMGGNVILFLGPKWRFHYYAHLHDIKAKSFSWANKNRVIGTVGSSGNAVGKPPHLHYSIVTPLPYIWRIDKAKQGWRKMFYLNPIEYLQKL
jgi:peptidoglycan LD-endopeptidase LytH